MSGLSSTGMKLIGQLEEAFAGVTRRLTVVEAATDDALRGSTEALQAVSASLATVEDLESRVTALEGRVFAEPPEPEVPVEPDEPEEPEQPPPVEPFVTILQAEHMADGYRWAARDGYAEAIRADSAPGPILGDFDAPVGSYEVWARVYGRSAASDAFQLDIGGKSWRVFPRQWGAWEAVPVGSVTLANEFGTHEVNLTPHEAGACVDAILISGEPLSREQAERLLGVPPALPVLGPVTEPRPTPAPTIRAFGFTPDDDFDPDRPVINGQVLSGEALRVWRGIAHLVRNYQARRYTEDGGIDNLAAKDSTYHLGRNKALSDNELFAVYALTGWKDALDELVRGFRIQRDTLRVGYRPDTPGYDASRVRQPASPLLGWGWSYSSGVEYIGTNYHVMDTAKTYAPILRLISALNRARGHTSRAGYDYGAEADRWTDLFREHFVPTWSGPERGGVAGWSQNYRGGQHRYYHGKPSAQRMGVNGIAPQPMLNRHHTHTHTSASVMTRYLGEALPELADAVEVGEHGIHTLLIQRNAYYFEGRYGECVAIPRSLQETGHGTLAEPSSHYVFPVTYYGYTISDLLLAHLDGWFAEFATLFGRPSANLITEYAIPSTPEGMGLPGDVTNNRAVHGRNLEGGTLTLPGAFDYTGDFGTPRSAGLVLLRGYALLLPFDPDGSYEAHMLKLLGSNGAYSDSRGTRPDDKPRLLSYNLGKLMQLTGVFARD